MANCNQLTPLPFKGLNIKHHATPTLYILIMYTSHCKVGLQVYMAATLDRIRLTRLNQQQATKDGTKPHSSY